MANGILSKWKNDNSIDEQLKSLQSSIFTPKVNMPPHYSPNEVLGPPAPNQSWDDYSIEQSYNNFVKDNSRFAKNAADAALKSHRIPTVKAKNNQTQINEAVKVNDPRTVYEDLIYRNKDNSDSDFIEIIGAEGLAPALFTDSGPLNPNNWPMPIGSSQGEKQLRQEQREWRDEHPSKLKGNADEREQNQLEINKQYEERFNEKGGIQNNSARRGFWTDLIDISFNIPSKLYTNKDNVTKEELTKIANPIGTLSNDISKIAKQQQDNGDNDIRNRTSLWITGQEYLDNYDISGGRPKELIDPKETYNKLDEAQNWNYMPYQLEGIDGLLQQGKWLIQDTGSKVSKAFRGIENTRMAYADPRIPYEDRTISYKGYNKQAGNYLNNEKEGWISSALSPESDTFFYTTDWNDQRRNENSVPTRYEWILESDDGTQKEIRDPFEGTVLPTGNTPDEVSLSWGDSDEVYTFPSLEYANEHIRKVPVIAEEGENIEGFYQADPLIYTEPDGTEVTIPFMDVVALSRGIDDGSIAMDNGPLNMFKPTEQTKEPLEMLTTLDFSDLAPVTVDMALQSLPIMFQKMIGPQMVADAMMSSSYIDPYSYDAESDSWRNTAEKTSADRYLTSVGYNLGKGALERIAQIPGIGKEGVLNKPLERVLENNNLPIWLMYPALLAGEMGEEDLTAVPEEISQNGLEDAFKNDLVIDGEIQYDDSGHPIKDDDTPLSDRFGNMIEALKENAVAGAMLAGPLMTPGVVSDVARNKGYVAKSRANKELKNYYDSIGMPRYKEAKETHRPFVLTPETEKQYQEEERQRREEQDG